VGHVCKLDYEYAFVPDIARDGSRPERAAYGQVVSVRLRHALLPKLISGELRVKDAEKFVEKIGA